MHITSKLAIARNEFKLKQGSEPHVVAISYDDARRLLKEFSQQRLCGFDAECELLLVRDNRDEIIERIENTTAYGMKLVVADITTIEVGK